MAKSVLSEPHFHIEKAAFAYVEARLWPNGPVCHHCGERERVGKLAGKTTRPGLYKCYRCRKPFTVRMGTIFESSHLPLRPWLQIIHLLCASKKGISTRQIQRMLQCSMKTAWFLGHRIRAAMDEKPGVFFSPIDGDGKAVKADETPAHFRGQLHRYLCEFDFRYSNRERLGVNDPARADLALDGVKGKRLTYETTRSQRPA
jgi:transposase-like protein